MKIALIGYGIENQATYRYFLNKGASVTICDQNPHIDLPKGANSQLGDSYLENLDRFDTIVRTSGMHPSVITDSNPTISHKVTTAVNIFFEECKTPIIGVTGTKGKGTTTSLIHKILTAAGKRSLLAGNIGIPVLDVLEQTNKCDYVAIELSSFQLQDLKYSPQIGVCLMVVPEHLNWHTNFTDYVGAKTNLFAHQNSDDVAIYNKLNKASREIIASSPARQKLPYGVAPDDKIDTECDVYVKDQAVFYKNTRILATDEIKLLGRHNLENICAAILATWNLVDGNIEAIRQATTSFSGLPYRLEFIRETAGVKYYNDSFSTTPETAIAALRSFSQPIVAILGGSDKGVPYDELANEVAASNVSHVLAIGQTGANIARLLRQKGFSSITTEGLNDMDSIVAKATALAQPGSIVLLSTGSASFDMFNNYKDRGDQFNKAVRQL